MEVLEMIKEGDIRERFGSDRNGRCLVVPLVRKREVGRYVKERRELV